MFHKLIFPLSIFMGPFTPASGRPGNLTCSVPWACKQGTPPIFSWKGATVSSQVVTTALSSVLTLTPRPQDHGTKLTCQVTLPGAEVTTARVVRLNVSCESWARTPGSLTGSEGRGEGGTRASDTGFQNPGWEGVKRTPAPTPTLSPFLQLLGTLGAGPPRSRQ